MTIVGDEVFMMSSLYIESYHKDLTIFLFKREIKQNDLNNVI